jgi:hypothetical protein
MAEPLAIIRPIGFSHTSGAITLPGVYQDLKTKENKYILQNGLIVNELGKKQAENNVKFHNQFMHMNIFEETHQATNLIAFYKDHPLVNVMGDKRKPNAKFELEVVAETKQENLSESKAMLKAMAFVDSLDEQGLKDLIYFFKGSPVGMSKDDMFLRLCSNKNGLLLNKENRDRLLKMYVDSSAKDYLAETQVQVFIQMALQCGYLEEKSQGALYVGHRMIAAKDHLKISFFLDNPEELENMKRALQENGLLSVTAPKPEPVKPPQAKEVVKKIVEDEEIEETAQDVAKAIIESDEEEPPKKKGRPKAK